MLGQNSYGEIGDGTQTVRLVPEPVFGLESIRQIDVGAQHTCALLMNGEVRCWGRNEHRQSLGFQTEDAVVLTTDRGPALVVFVRSARALLMSTGCTTTAGPTAGVGTFKARWETEPLSAASNRC